MVGFEARLSDAETMPQEEGEAEVRDVAERCVGYLTATAEMVAAIHDANNSASNGNGTSGQLSVELSAELRSLALLVAGGMISGDFEHDISAAYGNLEETERVDKLSTLAGRCTGLIEGCVDVKAKEQLGKCDRLVGEMVDSLTA